MQYFHIIYKLIFPNNKIYIGQTLKEFYSYMNDYKNVSQNKNLKGYNRPVNKAIRKYGWNNIQKEILFTTSEKFVDELETKMIAEYKSADREFGYNILKIGGSFRGFKHSEETKNKLKYPKTEEHKQKLREKRLGQKHSNETKNKIKIALTGINNPFYGQKHSEKSKEKIRQAHLGKFDGKNNPMFGKKRTDLVERNKNNPPMLGHRHSDETKKIIGKKLQKSVNFFINNNFIKNFNSIKDASIELNLTTSFICLLLKNTRKSSKGYIFKYNN